MSIYSISSYNDFTASAQSHIQFYQMVRSVIEAERFEDKPKKPLEALTSKVSVGGKPFSMAKHITTIDMRSDEWDLFEADEKTIAQLHEAHQYFKTVIDPTYDTGGSILGFAEACERVGIDPNAQSAVIPKEHSVTFTL